MVGAMVDSSVGDAVTVLVVVTVDVAVGVVVTVGVTVTVRVVATVGVTVTERVVVTVGVTVTVLVVVTVGVRVLVAVSDGMRVGVGENRAGVGVQAHAIWARLRAPDMFSRPAPYAFGYWDAAAVTRTEDRSAVRTCSRASDGKVDQIRAAAPATWGDAIDVPLS